MAQSLRDKLDGRFQALKTERARGWESNWRELAEYIEPRTGRWCLSDSNNGERRDQKIINASATYAARALEAGMMSGITSPSRKWFNLATPDPDLMEYGPVKVWLHQVSMAMNELFARSNLYNVLPTIYGENGIFGTACMAAMPDQQDLVRFYPFTVGSYYIANSARLQVDTVYREFRMTARQMAQQFGQEALSQTVRGMLDSKGDSWIDVCHAIEPNDDRVSGRMDNKNMPYRSVYFEKNGDRDKVLRQSGFRDFPAMAPRWKLNGEDVYGTGPGSIAIGDTKALQLMERRKAEMVEKGVRPPMIAPESLRNQKASIVPGDITYVNVQQGTQGFVPALTVDPGWLTGIRGEIQAAEDKINTAFFVDLFLMVSQMDSVRTATEIAVRKEEKMLMLGPVLERLNDELLDPLIDRTFGLMLEQSAPIWAGLMPGRPALPPPPKELAGMDLRVEYTSILAQAQKALGVSSIERTVGFAGNLAGLNPEVLDKLDMDQAVDEYAAMIGVPPTMLRSDDQIAQIRQQRAEAQAQQAQAEQLSQSIQGAKLLSETDVSSPNALTAIAGGV
ncbi:MAG: portal protein [Pseudomonadota bacterium]|uniref:portal protein n=1 Tax=Halopseudomonas aestusnigri TaxID=857252 RepID=UPI001D17F84F|nr:portal protein [Halopseudomonas aestusnigri]MCC4260789.1 portal protein [Halopseudomonas aestusnigri]MEC7472928.1 portal protein [Pseudomonadota bacterium]